MSTTTQTDAFAGEVKALETHLLSYAYPTSVEAELQIAVETVLRDGGFTFQSQVNLPKIGRIDLVVKLNHGSAGVELKTKGGRTALLLQIARYAECPMIDGLLVLTTISRLTDLPEHVMGKPVFSARLPNTLF